ncbi:MAG: DUF1232 domain-containing protein [Bacteroidales bacterium]|nr:DUF1232 domain-containing protein [Bacteroidales bacterium]
MKAPSNIPSYQKHYSEAGLWDKIASAGKKAGVSLIYKALQLYYAATDSNTSWEKKAIIYGALGYLILPADLIPDFIPVVGFTDDAATLTAAYEASSSSITPAVERNAKNRLSSWFSSSEISKL